jgi:hypothetical protein
MEATMDATMARVELDRNGRIASRPDRGSGDAHDLVADLIRDHGRLDYRAIAEREQANGVRFGPFHRAMLLERAPEKVRRLLELAALRPDLVGMPEALFTGPEGQASGPPSSFTAVSASATEGNLWTPAIWTPIPANSMMAGKIYKVSYGGIFTTTATQGTLTFTPRLGQSSTPASNVTLGASNAVAWAASLTNAAFYGELTAVCRSLGLAASGATFVGNGIAFTQGAAAATATAFVYGGSVPATVDNTAASGMIVSATISVASQSIQAQWVTPVRSYN